MTMLAAIAAPSGGFAPTGVARAVRALHNGAEPKSARRGNP
ncbi:MULTISPECIES: hypothetical protein [Caulobacter]|nr:MULTISPECIES: hypothetical protein [Caulobacter]